MCTKLLSQNLRRILKCILETHGMKWIQLPQDRIHGDESSGSIGGGNSLTSSVTTA